MSFLFRCLKSRKAEQSKSNAAAEYGANQDSIVPAASTKTPALSQRKAYGIEVWVEGQNPVVESATSFTNYAKLELMCR